MKGEGKMIIKTQGDKMFDGRVIDTETFLTETKRKLNDSENWVKDLVDVRAFLLEAINIVGELVLRVNLLKEEIEEGDKTISILRDGNKSLVKRNNILFEQLCGSDDCKEDYEKKINSLELKNKVLGRAIRDALEKVTDIRNELLRYEVAFLLDTGDTNISKTENLQDDDCK